MGEGTNYNVGYMLTVRENFRQTFERLRQQQTQAQTQTTRAGEVMSRVYGRIHNIRVNTREAIQRSQRLSHVYDRLQRTRTTILQARDRTRQVFSRINSNLRRYTRGSYNAILRAKDATGSVIETVKNKIFNLKSLAAGIVIGLGVKSALESGAMLEKQMVSMGHFIGINNKGMSEQDVTKERDKYIKELRENANATPFETQEVITAGARAVNVANGDTSKAMNLVKIAENMAALNPTKSLDDAMEALAGLKTGETERMKGFGFKISQDDIKNAGGIENIINKQIQPFFEGGAEKLAGTASGLWSTIKGKIGSQIQDTGLSVLEGLKPRMESVIGFIDRISPTLSKIGEGIGTGVGIAAEKIGEFADFVGEYMPQIKETVGSVGDWIGEKFGWIADKTDFLKEYWATCWEMNADYLITAWGVIKPIIDLIASSIEILFGVFEWAFPAMQGIMQTVWGIIKPILQAMGDLIGFIAKGAGKLADFVNGSGKGDNDNKDKPKGKDKPKPKGKGKPKVDGSHASGLTRVPKDGYIAELHKDEAVIPAKDNPFLHPANNRDNSTTNSNSFVEYIQDFTKSNNHIENIQNTDNTSQQNSTSNSNNSTTNNFNITINGADKSTPQMANELAEMIVIKLENM
ncbi:hypothetical protein [Anaerophilus nitritogenes]|uniref:hypothetical protein n=1 Tax=Anaerophilus nitritogenes TaxID=2498136 RepID=UPI00101B999F|nr:hypothetical protein [Anaerophilus nitritogenes]